MTTAGIERLPERWLSQREACDFFGVSPDYLLVLEGEGLLSPIRDGGRLVRYWPADVLAAIQKRGHRRPRRSRQVPDLQVAAARNL